KNKNIKNGSVGIVAIPQKRKNGQLRTQGFLKALKENNYKAGGLLEQIDFSCDETYRLTEELLSKNKSIKAIWLQGSDRYKAALRAINDLELKKDVSLITFDAEPEFLELIPKGVLIASGMQQPFLMGTKAIESLDKHLKGKKVQKIKQLDVLTVSTDNIKNNITNIQRNVFGIK
ncbi:MAG: substrate-binding domain-containing protein, partial [Campylobacterota bacterium]